MDKIIKTFNNKVDKDGKIHKKHLKNKEKVHNKSKYEQLLIDFKHRKNITNSRKITTENQNAVSNANFSYN